MIEFDGMEQLIEAIGGGGRLGVGVGVGLGVGLGGGVGVGVGLGVGVGVGAGVAVGRGVRLGLGDGVGAGARVEDVLGDGGTDEVGPGVGPVAGGVVVGEPVGEMVAIVGVGATATWSDANDGRAEDDADAPCGSSELPRATAATARTVTSAPAAANRGPHPGRRRR